MILDSPTMQDFLQKNAAILQYMQAADKDVEHNEESAASAPIPSMPSPTAPDMRGRTAAGLGANMASAISGNPMFMQQNFAGNQEEDTRYANALRLKEASDAENNRQIHMGILEARRDSALARASTARDIGHAAFENESLREAHNFEKQRLQIQEDFEKKQLETSHQNRMSEIQAEIAGRIKELDHPKPITGNPSIDRGLQFAQVSQQVDLEAAKEYENATHKSAIKDPRGFNKWRKNDAGQQRIDMLINAAEPSFYGPEKDEATGAIKETPEIWASRLLAMGVPTDKIKRFGQIHFPDTKFNFEGDKGKNTAPAAPSKPGMLSDMASKVGSLFMPPPDTTRTQADELKDKVQDALLQLHKLARH